MEVENTELTETGGSGKSLQPPENTEAVTESALVERREKQGSQRNTARKTAGSPAAGQRKKAASKSGKTNGSGRRAGSGSSGSGRHRKHRRSGTGVRKQPVTESFRHAFDGIFTGLGERNMKIHCTMAVLVVIFGVFLRISVTEWCLCLVLFGLIMGLELVNTAVEAVVDLVTEEYHPLAKKAKDTAAGAVLIAAIMAAIAGLIIFIPRLLYVFHRLL